MGITVTLFVADPGFGQGVGPRIFFFFLRFCRRSKVESSE